MHEGHLHLTDLSTAVHRQLLAALGQQGELWDQLLRELMGAIHVVAARDDAGQLVGRHVCLHHHLCIPGTVHVSEEVLQAMHVTIS